MGSGWGVGAGQVWSGRVLAFFVGFFNFCHPGHNSDNYDTLYL